MGSHRPFSELQYREGSPAARLRALLSLSRRCSAILVLAALPFIGQTDWPSYGHDAGGQRYSPLTKINAKNVARLKEAWTFDLFAPIPNSTRPRRSSTTPLVVGEVMYRSTPYNRAVRSRTRNRPQNLGI